MYNRNSDHARNKRDPDAIVYQDTSGNTIRLTWEDFANEEEFLLWKAWSDADYHRREKEDHLYSDHTESIEAAFDWLPSVPPLDSKLGEAYDRQEQERVHTEFIELLENCLSETQFRRLWMHHVEGRTVREIARIESISYQCVSKSIRAAEKKIFKILKKQGDKRP